jgi:hypothetical protein
LIDLAVQLKEGLARKHLVFSNLIILTADSQTRKKAAYDNLQKEMGLWCHSTKVVTVITKQSIKHAV